MIKECWICGGHMITKFWLWKVCVIQNREIFGRRTYFRRTLGRSTVQLKDKKQIERKREVVQIPFKSTLQFNPLSTVTTFE